MIETWHLAASVIASFGAGVGIGYKVQHPNITQDETFCDVLARSNSDWNKSIKLGRTFKNRKCVSVSCPVHTESTHICSITNKKCVHIT